MSRLTRSWSSPFGPFTLTSSGSIVISTPPGREIGCFPIRLMARLPDPRHQLAADAGAPGVVAGHHAMRGRHDRGPHSAVHLGHGPGGHVLAPPGLRHALEPLNHRLARLGVLEAHAKHPADSRRLDGEVLDVALLAQYARQLGLEGRRGHLDLVMVGAQPIADAGQEVCDGVGLRHLDDHLLAHVPTGTRKPSQQGRRERGALEKCASDRGRRLAKVCSVIRGCVGREVVIYCPAPSRCTNFVFTGSLWPASRMASRASGSGTPESSNITRPGFTTATHPSGVPLPEPMRVSAGFFV